MEYSPGLHIIIVRPGITGLATATSLRRAAHTIALYEKSALPSTCRPMSFPGNENNAVGWTTAKELTGVELYYAHRVDLHGCLKWTATRPEGLGKPATINLMFSAVAYGPFAQSITLVSGEVISADVVIGADGVRSNAVEAVIGGKVQTMRPRIASTCYRFLVLTDEIEAGPKTQFWNENSDGWSSIMVDSLTGRSVVSYSCRGNTIHKFALVNNEATDMKMCAEDDNDPVCRAYNQTRFIPIPWI